MNINLDEQDTLECLEEQEVLPHDIDGYFDKP